MAKKKISAFLKVIGWIVVLLTISIITTVCIIYYNKEKIITSIIHYTNQHLNTKVEISQSIDLSLIESFPLVSIGFKYVRVYESIPPHAMLGEAQSVKLSFDLWDLWNKKYIIKKIIIDKCRFNLKLTQEGTPNFEIIKNNSSTNSTSSAFHLKEISIRQAKIVYHDIKKRQVYDVMIDQGKASIVKQPDIGYLINVQSTQTINNISINGTDYFTNKNSALKTTLSISETGKNISLHDSWLNIEHVNFSIRGNINTEKATYMDISISHESGTLEAIYSILPRHIMKSLRDYKSSGKAYFNAIINGEISDKKNPAIEVRFGLKNATIYHPELDKKIEQITLIGIYSNGIQQNLATSILDLSNLSFNIDHNHISGKLTVKNFSDPYIQLYLNGNISTSSIFNTIKTNTIKDASGSLLTEVSFDGRLENLKSAEGRHKINAHGKISVDSVNIVFKNDLSVKNISGSFVFDKADVHIPHMYAKIGQSDINVKGTIEHFWNYLFLNSAHLYLKDFNIKSQYLHTDDVINLFKIFATPGSSSVNDNKKIFLQTHIHINKLQHKNLELHQFRSQLEYSENWMLKNTSFKTFGGKITCDTFSSLAKSSITQYFLTANISALPIDSILYAFDNFGQNFISWQNLHGKFYGNLTMLFAMNDSIIIPSSIFANADCKITDGRLENFAPMQQLARFIDANELAHIKFSELKNNILIRNDTILLPEMQILSNVANISISGIHTLSGSFEYKLAIPLKNLRKHKVDPDAAFGSIENDSKQGATLYLSFKGNSNSYAFHYDKKRTKQKIKDDLKKEKNEFLTIFKKKKQEITPTEHYTNQDIKFLDLD
ncbi:MAG: DUF3971 domain-containing protein [Cytophagaceae bacterium]|nr:DUF3971 domain-containing protein [Cytophagaceae bacterium]MDW8456259.1 AsmA-like C-terminal region-containing protein [Cytophagaceae bacterium]